MSPPLIRRALAEDAPHYAAAAERFFRQTYGHDAAHAAVMDAHCAQVHDPKRIAAQLAAPDVTALVAVSEKGIIGLAQVHAAAPDGELLRFYIDRDWHGRGLAQALMEEVIVTATSRGITTLRLGVAIDNARAVAFYRRQGFHPAGSVDFLLAGVPQSDLLMQRSLPSGKDDSNV